MDVLVALKNSLKASQILVGEALKDRYHHIWHMDQPLNAKALLLPEDTSELSTICKICTRYNCPIIVFGGLTNLVGGTETTGDEIIISMERFNSILDLDELNRTITVEAGVVLENIHEAAKESALFLPLNFGAKGSAQIGGIISTNAGGLRVLRYGMTRNYVLGLEVVLMDGTVLTDLKKIIKNNSAYNLKHLFIGSEGTLGIITKAVLKLYEAPISRNSGFLAFDNFENIISFLKLCDLKFAGNLSAFELVWGNTYNTLTNEESPWKPPLPHGAPYYILIETLGANIEIDRSLMLSVLESAISNKLAVDAVFADNEADLNWFWNIREDVRILSKQTAFDQHFDVSAPTSGLGDYIEGVKMKLDNLEGVEHVFPFGHLADGNIHFTVSKNIEDQALTNTINDIVYGPLKKVNGSVSAEHGIGKHKKEYLHLCRTRAEIELMRTIKKTMDPKGLLNPGKVLDVNYDS